MPHHVVIVGGGLSGLAAGVSLATQGIRVTILEQKPSLGGRAYSFKDTVTGDTIDNGQHVLIAGYDRTMRFLETIGTRELLHIQKAPSLLFHHPVRGFQEFRLPLLPSPLNLLFGILRCQLFSFRDRLRLLRAGINLMESSSGQGLVNQTVGQWLNKTGQTQEGIRSFWEPLAVSMMNERIEKASAQVFVNAVRKAFLGGSRNAALVMPAVGLSQLYVDGARQYIAMRAGDVRSNADVVEVTTMGGLVTGVKTRNGDEVPADAVILTVPPHKLVPILPQELARKHANLSLIDVAPIVSVHLWFAGEFMHHEFVGIIGKRIQWLFNKRRIVTERGAGAHVSAVISGAYDFVEMSKDELVNVAVEDIRSVYPECHEEPYHAVVVREKRATYSSSPLAETLRPPYRTEIPNLFLAGDWTMTGYPATIEGAILSAEGAAALARQYLIERPAD